MVIGWRPRSRGVELGGQEAARLFWRSTVTREAQMVRLAGRATAGRRHPWSGDRHHCLYQSTSRCGIADIGRVPGWRPNRAGTGHPYASSANTDARPSGRGAPWGQEPLKIPPRVSLSTDSASVKAPTGGSLRARATSASAIIPIIFWPSITGSTGPGDGAWSPASSRRRHQRRL
jgi:hypothetical protein